MSVRCCRGSAKTTDWLKCFDVVIVGCGKPAFFNNSGQLFHVDVKTGMTD
jgi:5'-nucleotidase